MWVSFLLRRGAALVATIIVASAVVFLAVSLTPGDPAVLLSGTTRPSAEQLSAVRAEYHLDEPIWVRYGLWLQGILGGDIGRSFVYNISVGDLVGPRLETSLLLVLYAAILIIVVGVGTGIWGALRPRAGRSIVVGSAIAMGAPTFVMATLLSWVFATQLGWFPVYGAGSGFSDMLWHLTLPAVSLSLAYIAYVSRITRTAVVGEMDAEHVQTAVVRGIPSRLIVQRHVLRNAAAPITTVTGITIAGLLAAAVVVEQAFGLDGIGSLLVASAAAKDIPVVQAIVLGIVILFALMTTAVDILNASLDPRLRTVGARR
ncbi:ABC transporter permease [Microbacterium rhizomatis]|uniref:ABC transporter permease n=1 Tax=Microbacterium rhizomatis TaxID=1631477 RepID=A0A5J5J034_9MICO|nr:ABC transporter permease [Microbacterium rhizomatis]KAA9106028.1 ABC transporter permease [Microbacterium rhizomatis]